MWRIEWPGEIRSLLVTDKNPGGTITNSNVELAGGLIHLEAIVFTFNVRKRTHLSKGEDLSTTFWEPKGSTTTNSASAHLLRLFGVHQQFRRYVPCSDYLAGALNHVNNALSRDFHLSLPALVSQLSTFLPQNIGY